MVRRPARGRARPGAEMSAAGPCRACGAAETIRAHIIPAAFGRFAGDGRPLRTISRETRQLSNSGVWDDGILCEACDRVLGRYDKAAIEFWRAKLLALVDRSADEFVIDPADTDTLVKFVTAVLWRASISTRREFATIRLGPYADKFKRMLFEGGDLGDLPQVMMFRYWSRVLPVERMYAMPIYGQFEGVNCYTLPLMGCRIVAKVDRRPLAGCYEPYIINGRSLIRGLPLELEATSEFAAMAAVVRDRRLTMGAAAPTAASAQKRPIAALHQPPRASQS